MKAIKYSENNKCFLSQFYLWFTSQRVQQLKGLGSKPGKDNLKRQLLKVQNEPIATGIEDEMNKSKRLKTDQKKGKKQKKKRITAAEAYKPSVHNHRQMHEVCIHRSFK